MSPNVLNVVNKFHLKDDAMKRISMLLVAVMVLSTVVATANPFSDVPFSHWSYDAVNKLTSKGILQGYPDGTFKGEKNVTRYHLAMVVAKMLSNVEQMLESGTGSSLVTKADLQTLEKLTVEFADELALLGVKVTALEDDMQIVKEDVAGVKKDVDSIKGYMARGGMEKVAISGDMIVRHDDQVKSKNLPTLPAPGINGDNVHTSAMFRLRFDANIDENVTAAVRYVMYADQFGHLNRFGNTLGGVAANAGALTGERQNDVDTAYLNVKDMFSFGGDFKFGRDFYTHGSALVLNDYVDAISYTTQSGKFDVALNAIYDRVIIDVVSWAQVDFRNVWNLNLDTKVKDHDIYLGYYTQNYIKDLNRTYMELGSKGALTKNGHFDYELGFVMANVETSAATVVPNQNPALKGAFTKNKDMEGTLIHAAVKWESKEEWAAKVAYTTGDDEYLNGIALDNNQRSYDAVETPFEDIAAMGYGDMQNADLVKVQAEYRPINSKHYFRLAYDMYSQDKTTGKAIDVTFTGSETKDEANIMTFEYRYQLAENTRIRAGYATLDGDEESKGKDDDRLFVEIYSRF